MTYSILSNKKNTSAVLHFTGSNTVIISGNNSVSNVAISDETLTGAYVTQVFYGNDVNGSIQIKRGNELISVYDSTGYVDYAGAGMALTAGNTAANLVVSFIGSSNAYLIVEIQKIGNFISEYFKN
jgi:hypothetical protein